MAPKTYYQILQVDPSAEPEIIEAAYKRLAKLYHPDLNPRPDAVSHMQEINEAYSVLHDMFLRRDYDLLLQRQATIRQPTTDNERRQSSSHSHSAQEPTYATKPPPQQPDFDFPKRCERCGVTNSTLRLTRIPYVVSVVILTFRRGWAGLYCEKCRRELVSQAKAITFFCGWWGIPFGIFYTLGTLFMPGDGEVPAKENAAYLRALGAYFLYKSRLQEAREAFKASLNLQYDQQTAQFYRSVFPDDTGSKATVNGNSPVAMWTIGVIIAVVLLGALVSTLTISTSSSDIQGRANTEAENALSPTTIATKAPRPSGTWTPKSTSFSFKALTLPTRTFRTDVVDFDYPAGMELSGEQDRSYAFLGSDSGMRFYWYDLEYDVSLWLQAKAQNSDEYQQMVSGVEVSIRDAVSTHDKLQTMERLPIDQLGSKDIVAGAYEISFISPDLYGEFVYMVYADFQCGQKRICILQHEQVGPEENRSAQWQLLAKVADSISFHDENYRQSDKDP